MCLNVISPSLKNPKADAHNNHLLALGRYTLVFRSAPLRALREIECFSPPVPHPFQGNVESVNDEMATGTPHDQTSSVHPIQKSEKTIHEPQFILHTSALGAWTPFIPCTTLELGSRPATSMILVRGCTRCQSWPSTAYNRTYQIQTPWLGPPFPTWIESHKREKKTNYTAIL